MNSYKIGSAFFKKFGSKVQLEQLRKECNELIHEINELLKLPEGEIKLLDFYNNFSFFNECIDVNFIINQFIDASKNIYIYQTVYENKIIDRAIKYGVEVSEDTIDLSDKDNKKIIYHKCHNSVCPVKEQCQRFLTNDEFGINIIHHTMFYEKADINFCKNFIDEKG